MLFPETKDLPSPYYLDRPAVPPDVATQSLAGHLYNELPDLMLRELSQSHPGLSSFGSREQELTELLSQLVRKSVSSAYKDWLHKQDWPISNVSAASNGDTDVDYRRETWQYMQSGPQRCLSEPSGETAKHHEKPDCPPVWDPQRPLSTNTPSRRTEIFLFQTQHCAAWHLQQYQKMPSSGKGVGSSPANPAHHLPEGRDDQGLWYKFYLAVVMLKRKEPQVGWSLAKEGCEVTRGVLEHPSCDFFLNLYNHFGSHKWDEFESLRLHILEYLKDMSAVLLGTNHPLTKILEPLAVEGFLKSVSERALKVMLDVYEKALGFMHPQVIQTQRSLCKVFRRQNEFSTATDRVKTMLKYSKEVNGRYDTNTRRCMRRLGHLYRYQEQYEDAEQMYRDVIQLAEGRSAAHGDLDDLALCTLHDLVSIAFRVRRYQAAESWARLAMAAVADGRNIMPENQLVYLLDLHKCLEEQGLAEEARDLEEQYCHIRHIPPQESREAQALLSSISKDHFAWVLAESGHPYLLPDAYCQTE